MCGTCEVYINENYKTIRKASLKYESGFEETNDLINTVVVKFLVWKKNKEANDEEISIKDGFFYTIAKRAAIDSKTIKTVNIEKEIEGYETNANNSVIHENLIAKTKFSSPENHALIMKYLDVLDEQEKDALLSIVTDEPPEDYQARNDIPVLNTAVKRRRRAFQKAQLKLNEDDSNVISMNSRENL